MTRQLCAKPDFEQAMKRIEAWFRHEKLDRPPVRFGLHNAEYDQAPVSSARWPTLKARWFDAEYQVDHYLEHARSRQFHGETFPVYWPNLGPNIYAAFFGAELDYEEVTSWIRHPVHSHDDIARLKFDWNNLYFQKIEEMTRIALEKCPGQALVGYTDLHGGLDCVADWRNPQELCLDLIDCPEDVRAMVRLADAHFFEVYDHYNAVLSAAGQPSVTWMGIPVWGKMHIPSCDFTNMIAPEAFDEFYLPSLKAEAAHMTHNIFHLDGKGVARHVDRVLEIPQIQAIQWVQGVGDDLPIMQWLPLMEKIQAAGKGLVIDIHLDELEPLIDAMSPEGIYLCLAAPESAQPAILERLKKW